MGQRGKFISKILSGTSDKNIQFDELCNLIASLGFNQRIKGSHHIFYKDGVEEIINIQSKNGKAKPYQVKDVSNIIIKYKLGGCGDA
ncbi:MAG: type II toxin-antitoxin system HicA family toxin [Oscillospiraceae bacterium]|nr:type II toxin-antitoxin system HicA family toxin [Oscillospiraceae bacterium]